MQHFSISTGIGLTVGSSIWFGTCIGYGIGHEIGFPLAGLFGIVLGRWGVSSIACRRHSSITGFDSFELEHSFRALHCLPLQNMVKEVFYDTLAHVLWVSEFEPHWEIFRIDK